MRSSKMAIAIGLILSLTVVLYWSKRGRSASATSAAVQALQQLASASAPQANEGTGANSPVNRSDSYRVLRDAYLDLRLSNSAKPINPNALITIAKGIGSLEDEIRQESIKMSIYMLSDWVFTRPASEWHSNPAVDAFFRVLKYQGREPLRRFLELDHAQKQKLYLSQI